MLRRMLALALVLAALAAAPAAAQVLYVGDSLGVGTAPPLRAELSGVTLDVDARTSRPSGAGIEVLAARLRDQHEVVVFDLGTNDDPGAPELLAADLAAAAELAAGRCLVVATINRPPLNGVDADGLNRAVTRFALRTPNVELVDWRRAVAARPDLLTDGVHAGPDGYAIRAALFAEAIRNCLAFAGGAPDAAPGPSPPAPEPAPPAPRRRPSPPKPEPDPVRELARELADAIAIGAEFG